MRTVSLSDLNRRPGEIVDMALAAPLVLTKHGRQAVVMMSAEAYNSLVSGRADAVSQSPSATDAKKQASGFLARQAAKTAAQDGD
ncbi:type II toxin-antitoxin system Phd/YefM family antitoxin [Pelagibacterium sp. H642]|uniref:type II toxin-antitoxin system Phd/YefM family antitoxin n=1 Tax=Pelagibacterium sp. H642 TaxID=1881069 RepID=UPI0028163449|nr:type II toxin-antitoxin system Phd/YefM family antitoxin [Pelagibacterium sp. H642]WMT91955.1 type II toxin-antitoxin system Phd/YefM family antitoxin [Pelagibacterium sp. H642]